MFLPGNENICDRVIDREVIFENRTHFHINPYPDCFSHYYYFAYKCDNEKTLKDLGFPNLTDTGTVKPPPLVYPTRAPNSKGYNITNEYLKQCWSILGDVIYFDGNELWCYLIHWGWGKTPVTSTTTTQRTTTTTATSERSTPKGLTDRPLTTTTTTTERPTPTTTTEHPWTTITTTDRIKTETASTPTGTGPINGRGIFSIPTFAQCI
jgi:hypothetical protein